VAEHAQLEPAGDDHHLERERQALALLCQRRVDALSVGHGRQPPERPRTLRIAETPLVSDRGPAARRPVTLTDVSRHDLLSEQLHNGDRRRAGGTFATDADAAHKGRAGLTSLLADGSLATAVILVDRDRASRPGLRHDGGRPAGVAPPAVGRSPTTVATEPLAASRCEQAPADGAGRRDGVVTQRGHGSGDRVSLVS